MFRCGILPILLLVVRLCETATSEVNIDRIFKMAPIIGGDDAKDGTAPYLAGLLTKTTPFCTGSIIDDRWILTAAHCLRRVTVNNTIVRVGTNNRTAVGTVHRIDRAIPHERYRFARYDVGLLRLKIPLKFGKTVQKIELSKKIVPNNATLTIVGWGCINYNRATSKIAQIIKVKNIELKRCRKYSPTDIYDGSLCTSSIAGKGICDGDSGGPVIWNGTQVGVVSWSRKQTIRGFPDIHQRISFLYEWIRKTIAVNSDLY